MCLKIHEGQSSTVGSNGVFTHNVFKVMDTEIQRVFTLLNEMRLEIRFITRFCYKIPEIYLEKSLFRRFSFFFNILDMRFYAFLKNVSMLSGAR